jgi:NAD(P)-dependent dehydrogenase (short-subunit alcohol dehydrogenase family)
MDLQLNDKKALVTGSSAGIGFAISTGLAREGATVVLNGRNPESLAAARARLLGEVPEAEVETVVADVATAAGSAGLIEAIPDVDILVNNAATFAMQPFAEISDAEWSRYFETNVMSGMRLSRHYLHGMLSRDDGRIVFISTDAAVHMALEMLPYSVTKTAALALARGLAEMTRGTRVTVNSVMPSATATERMGEMVSGMAGQTGQTPAEFEAAMFQNALPTSLLERLIEPQEIANLVVYLASPLSSATNGDAVRAEGGVVRSPL